MATNGLYGNSPNGATVAAPGAATSGLYGSGVTGQINQAPGAESIGLYGQGNQSTGNTSYFEYLIFQDSLNQPPQPTGGSWNFTTNVGTPPAGWSNIPPTVLINRLWISIGLVNSNNATATIQWSTPGTLSNSSTLPDILSGTGVPTTAPVVLPSLYVQTDAVGGYALWAYANATDNWEPIVSGGQGATALYQLTDVNVNEVTTFTQVGSVRGVDGFIIEANAGTDYSVLVNSSIYPQGSALGGGTRVTSATNYLTYWELVCVTNPVSAGFSSGSPIFYKPKTIQNLDLLTWDFLTSKWVNKQITNTLSNPVNTLTSVVNGVQATAPVVNTVSNTINSGQLTTLVNGVASTPVNLPATGVTSVTAADNTITIGGTASAPTVAVNTATEATRVTAIADTEIATKIGSLGAPAALTSTGLLTTTQAFGTQTGITTCNIATLSHDAGRTFLMSIGSTLSGTTWSAPTTNTYIGISASPNSNAVTKILGAQDANGILQLDLQTNAVLAALHSGPYTLFSAPEKFTFVPPPQTEIVRLINQNIPVGVTQLPFDVITWTNNNQVAYVSDKAIAPVSSSVHTPETGSLLGAWVFPTQTLAGFTDQAEVIGTDSQGRTVSGRYQEGTGGTQTATLIQVNFERTSGFQLNTAYTLTWRQGLTASATIYVDNGNIQNAAKAESLGPGTGVTITPDPVNTGRYLINAQAQATGVTSLDGVTGAVLLASPDNTVTVGVTGQTITLSAGTPSVAGVATGYNVGPYVVANMAISAGSQTPPGTAANEGEVQIGTGTGYSTNTSVLASAPSATPKLGWTFGGQKANNVTFELGTQKQKFRLGISGTWNTTPVSLPIYGTSAVVNRPVILKYNTDFDSGFPFPGLVTASGSAAGLNEVATVSATARYCIGVGKTVSAVSVTFPSSNRVAVNLTLNNRDNIVSNQTTIPLEVTLDSGVNWLYLGSEWDIIDTPAGTNVVTLNISNSAVPNVPEGVQVRVASFATGVDALLYPWTPGLPPSGTQFGPDTTAVRGYVEVYLPPNIWTADTINYKPDGFTLPTADSYNFNWTLVCGANVLNTLQYWHYTRDDQYFPTDNVPNWNNRITVNYGAQGNSIPGNLWDTWAINWTNRPIKLVTDSTGRDPNGLFGNIISYQYGGITRYRFYIPGGSYSSAYDAFYSNYTSATKTVSGLLTARSS